MNPEKPLKPAKQIRKPVQSRSIITKERILDAALSLFCEKGYYKTTTNEIAQRAKVSIGSLYSYFKDKDTIFIEILEKYHQKFDMAKSEVLNNQDFFKSDCKGWLKSLIEHLIKVHEDTKELNRELIVLSYYNSTVAEILEQNKKRTMHETIGYFAQMYDGFAVKDVEAAITISFDLLSATVDRIVFGKNEMDRNRLIEAAIDAVYKYIAG